MKFFTVLIVLILLLSGASALVQLIAPNRIILEELEEVTISPVGPGHNLVLKFDRDSGKDIFWDSVRILNRIDDDWVTSLTADQNFLYFNLAVPKDKPAGFYTFKFIVEKELPGIIEPEIAVVRVLVSHDQDDLVELSTAQKYYEIFAAEDELAFVQVTNKASSETSYTLVYWFEGFPSFKQQSLTLLFNSGESKTVELPFTLPTEGEYLLKVKVSSEVNPTISKLVSSSVVAKPTLRSKLISIANGFPLVPITMTPFFALLGLLGAL